MTSDEIFLRELAESEKYVDIAVDWYTRHGVKAYKGQMYVRPSYEERFEYSDHGDLFIPGSGWVDVKHRDVNFPPYPFKDVYTITKHAFERTPCYQYFIINRDCTHAMIVDSKTSDRWKLAYTRGKDGSPLTLYSVPEHLFRLVQL